MGFLNSLKSNLMKTGGRFARGAVRQAKHFAPMVGKVANKIAQYAPVAQKLVGHLGNAAAGVSGVIGGVSTGNLPGAIASGINVVKAVKSGVREVKGALKNRKRKGMVDTTQTFGKLPKAEGSGGRMTGDFVSEMKKSSGSV